MRFALLVSAAALTTLAGCGSSAGPSADGAWFISMDSGSTGMCLNATDVMSMVGSITGQNKGMVIVNGENSTSISCSVTPAASGAANAFDVTASGQAMGGDPIVTKASTLDITVQGLTAGASMTSPATGKVAFISVDTQDNEYASDACNFYFSPSTDEGVSLGQVWVTFACPSIVDGQQQSTCELLPSFAIFENCATM